VNPYLILGALLMALSAGAGGYVKGRADNEAKHVAAWAVAQQEATETGIALAAAETERLALVEANRMISRELEDQAYAEPVYNAACLSPSRGLRLDQRIKAANRAAAGQP
jgi:hypothetical protein